MILVTGGFGFIGSHLVASLLRDGRRVHVVDDMSTAPLPLEHVLLEMLPAEQLLTAPLRWNVQRMSGYNPLGLNVHMIYHLASPVGPAGVLQHKGKIVQRIVEDTQAVIELARVSGARLVFVSTSELYNGGLDGLCVEGMARSVPTHGLPRAEYAAGKLAAEVMVQAAVLHQGLDAVIVRPFNVAGPRQSGRGGFVLPRFVGQALAGQPLTIFGDGRQRRAFTHVADIVKGLRFVASKGTAGQAYNLGNPANHGTVKELAQLVLAETRSDSDLSYVDPQTIYGPHYAEAADKYPDSGSAFALGWQPRYDRRATVRDVVQWMRGLPDDLRTHVSGIAEGVTV